MHHLVLSDDVMVLGYYSAAFAPCDKATEHKTKTENYGPV